MGSQVDVRKQASNRNGESRQEGPALEHIVAAQNPMLVRTGPGVGFLPFGVGRPVRFRPGFEEFVPLLLDFPDGVPGAEYLHRQDRCDIGIPTTEGAPARAAISSAVRSDWGTTAIDMVMLKGPNHIWRTQRRPIHHDSEHFGRPVPCLGVGCHSAHKRGSSRSRRYMIWL